MDNTIYVLVSVLVSETWMGNVVNSMEQYAVALDGNHVTEDNLKYWKEEDNIKLLDEQTRLERFAWKDVLAVTFIDGIYSAKK